MRENENEQYAGNIQISKSERKEQRTGGDRNKGMCTVKMRAAMGDAHLVITFST